MVRLNLGQRIRAVQDKHILYVYGELILSFACVSGDLDQSPTGHASSSIFVMREFVQFVQFVPFVQFLRKSSMKMNPTREETEKNTNPK